MKNRIARILFRLILTALAGPVSAFAQETQAPVLTLNEFLVLVQSNHPIAKQIGLLSDRAQAQLQLARGGFDPKLYGAYDDKLYDQKNYWRVFESGVKIPTGLAAEIKGGYVWNDGSFLNPEQNLPVQGQAVMGISVPLGQGLFIDPRRAALQQARIFQAMAEVEQVRLLNDLFFDAARIYWEWAAAWARLQLLQDAVSASEQRFQAVRATFFAGDYAGIDTTEALTQLQNFQLQENEATIDFLNAGFALSNFLWTDEGQPLEITAALRPVTLAGLPLPPLVSDERLALALEGLGSHPEVRVYDFKQSELDVERRLKIERLKPTVDLEYNFLSPGTAFMGENFSGDWQWGQNYKWGLSVDFPLFLRKERGDLALTRIKMQENEWQQDLKRQAVANKILAYINELRVLREQVQLSLDAVENYRRLLEGEEIKFRAGESTLFLINAREMTRIGAEIKLLELRSKLFKAEAGLIWAMAAPRN